MIRWLSSYSNCPRPAGTPTVDAHHDAQQHACRRGSPCIAQEQPGALTKWLSPKGDAIALRLFACAAFFCLFLEGSNAASSLFAMDNDHATPSPHMSCTCTVRVRVFGDGIVLRSPVKPRYTHGDQVELTAVPAPGETFLGWSGELEGPAHAITLVIDGNKDLTATFSGSSLHLTLDTLGAGAIQAEPQQESYAPGAQVTLTAAPAAGWQFAGWDGNFGATNPLRLTMHRNRRLVATFVQLNYTLSLGLYANGRVAISQHKERYQHGDLVTLTAFPDAGYHFVEWQIRQEDAKAHTIIPDNPATIRITANIISTPRFADTLDNPVTVYLPVIAANNR